MIYRLFFLFFCIIIQGQNIDDAISLTFENNNGNARFSSMSGAFSSLGGNLSAISINPASSSVFELSRLGFSLNGDSKDVQSSFSNSSSSVNSNYFNFQGGIVYVFKNYGEGKFRKFSFGINNIFDKNPPLNGKSINYVPGNANTYPSYYDPLGRFIYLNISKRIY